MPSLLSLLLSFPWMSFLPPSAVSPERDSPVPDEARQLVLVLTAGPEATTGRLSRFERVGREAGWTPVGASWPITVGRSGLATGLGLHEAPIDGLPVKREGDGKSPAGVLALTQAFGFAPSPPEGSGLLYLSLKASTECIDDPRSTHYAAIVDRSEVDAADWRTAERMREIPAYEWGVVVAHNPERLEGAGSCIFLHAWSGTPSPTAGCTAMELAHIRDLVAWLTEEDSPVLVQLTEDAYQKLRERFGLPPAAQVR